MAAPPSPACRASSPRPTGPADPSTVRDTRNRTAAVTRADARLGEVRSWAPAGLPLNPLPALVTPRTVPKRRPRPAAFRLETTPFSSGIKMHFKARSQAAPSVRLSLMLQTHAELTPQPRARGTARSSLMKSARSRGSRPLASVTVLPAGRPMQREPRRGLQPQSQHRAAAPPPTPPRWSVASSCPQHERGGLELTPGLGDPAA